VPGLQYNSDFTIIRTNEFRKTKRTYNDQPCLQMESALNVMFGVQCPSMFDGVSSNINEGFEDGSATFGDSVASDVPAFCGRYSIKNNRNLFPVPEGKASTVNFNFNKYVS